MTRTPPGAPSRPELGMRWPAPGAKRQPWELAAGPDGFVLTDRYGVLHLPRRDAHRLVITRRWWRTLVQVTDDPHRGRQRLRGLSRADAAQLADVVNAMARLAAMDGELTQLVEWGASIEKALTTAAGNDPRPVIPDLADRRPPLPRDLRQTADTHHQLLLPDEQAALTLHASDLDALTVPTTPPPSKSGHSADFSQRLAGTALADELPRLLAWHARVDETLKAVARERRWVSHETVTALEATRPGPSAELLRTAAAHWTLLSVDEQAAITLRPDALRLRVDAVNAQIVTDSLTLDRAFFDTIERTPLTEEQARAVLTIDNRVHVIAAAGSGKTSVMVGRAAYAVQRGFTTPDRVLLLAFNKAAAAELDERVTDRFAAAGIDSDGVRATTFHAFGLDVIGQATGRRPSLAPWVADGAEAKMIETIVKELRAADSKFALQWDMFRLLYARVSDDWANEATPDGWDPNKKRAGLQTFGGDVVASQGERLIADWLYLNGVTYEYERPYVHDTATAERRQYQPDFYYPDIAAWHEHWGVDANGNPPPRFRNYRESMAWKKQLHAEHGTTLIETTWAGIMAGDDFLTLAHELRSRGIALAWDPNRPTTGAQPVKDGDLVRLVRTFMSHVKSSSLTREAVADRLRSGRNANTARSELFLKLYWRIHDAWQDRLAAGGYVDFEDMLLQAAEQIEAGRYDSAYDFVLVDELQDASQARAHLVRALVARPGRHLLAVGDDWQSINRFAGADHTVLSRFHDHFGPGPSLYLTTTFRCHQAITNTATTFIAKNPDQLTKTVTSAHRGRPNADAFEGVQLRQVELQRAVPSAIGEFLDELDAAVTAGHVPLPAGRALTVDVLGRYQFDRQLLPSGSSTNFDVTFRTIHSAKGLEADFVIVPNLSTGVYGFPSQITDDPVLSLAMSDSDSFEHAEERRLFYVALTRARRGVILFAPRTTPSRFVTELIADGLVRQVGNIAGQTYPCPVCRAGVLVKRSSRFGVFWGCSDFPACRHTTNTAPSAVSSGPVVPRVRR